MSRIKVSVIGAGGKMGTRTSNNLALKPDEFELMMAEASEAGIRSGIRERGFEPVSVEGTGTIRCCRIRGAGYPD